MGDLELHYQKLEEAKNQGIEEGKKQAAEEAAGDGSGAFWLILVVLIVISYFCSQNDARPAEQKSASVSQYTEQTAAPSSELNEYIASTSTRFYKYSGSHSVTYIRHHYEPNDQQSKQGYYKSDTGDHVLLTINYYQQSGSWVCNWRIDHLRNSSKTTLSNGTDNVTVPGFASANCITALVQALEQYGFDPVTYTTDGTEIPYETGCEIVSG